MRTHRRRREWHPEDIKAEVRKRGKTLTQLSREAGLAPNAIGTVWKQPRYRIEQAIAAFIGVPAQELWPNRYEPDGTPRDGVARSRIRAGVDPVHGRVRPGSPRPAGGDAGAPPAARAAAPAGPNA